MLVLTFILGIVILSLGAEIFVRGASNVAARMGISSLIIGLTVVAFGTSAPELAVVVQAGFAGQADLAIGNIIGSNISNFLLILGIVALISPLVVSHRLIRIEVPLLFVVSGVVFYLAYDGRLSTFDGLILFAGSLGYTIYIIYSCMKLNGCQEAQNQENKAPSQETVQNPASPANPARRFWGFNIMFLLTGLGGLVVGATWVVEGASGIARLLGISELIIGLTMVAIGTSLPELATAIAAGLRGERDIVIGNVIGSNLFNLMFVLGAGVVILPQGLPVPSSSISFDFPVMLAITAACLPIFFSGYRISRWEGLFFLSYYGAYILYLFMFSVEHDFLPAYSTLMLQYILPLTALLLIFVLMRSIRFRKRQEEA